MATLKLNAELGINAKEFKKGIDGATEKVKEISVSMRTMKKLAATAFGLGMMGKVVDLYKELQEYQDKTGKKLIDDQDMIALDEAAATIKEIKMDLVAGVGNFFGQFLGGVKTLAATAGAWLAGARGEELDQIVSQSVSTTKAQDPVKIKELEAKVAEHNNKLAYEGLSIAEKLAKKYAEITEIRKQASLYDPKTERQQILELEEKRLLAAEEIHKLEKESTEEQKKKAKEASRLYEQKMESERKAQEAEDQVLDELMQNQMENEDKAVEALLRRKKKEKEIREEGEKEKKDLLAGKESNIGAIKIGGGLQSIGGYFASKGAVNMATQSRAEVIQTEIKKILDKVERNTAKLASEDGGE